MLTVLSLERIILARMLKRSFFTVMSKKSAEKGATRPEMLGGKLWGGSKVVES